MDKCPHMNFEAHTSVARITEGEGGPVSSFMAHIKIECRDCHLPFQFIGLELGLHMRGSAMSVDGQEARLAIAPVGSVPQPLDKFLAAGFRVKSPESDH